MDSVSMKQARKVYRAECAKGEKESFRAWARDVYWDVRLDTKLSPKLARVMGVRT